MWRQFTLRARIFVFLTALVLMTLVGASVTMLLVYRIGTILGSVIDRDLVALNVAQELETSLVMQKGYLTYYFLDGNPTWLKQLNEYRHSFERVLSRARNSSYTDAQREILNEIESRYIRYSHGRDQVIELYEAGRRDQGFDLHRQIRNQFSEIRDLSDQYREEHNRSIAEAQSKIRSQVKFITSLAAVAMPGTLVLGFLLGSILLKQVLRPIRHLAMQTVPGPIEDVAGNEVKALNQVIQGLIKDIDQTHVKLKWSREHLLQSEKLAQVGKLAAGVAHSIRNPLTSVKMRLFSLERSLSLTASQREDFEVISEEIRHIDTIVRNFLEFSRPPKLKMQRVSPSDVVDMALQLLRHRLESYGMEITLRREHRLPEIMADSEQLKEVFVNLLINAYEAMGDGGSVVINEMEGKVGSYGEKRVIIAVSDNGPGIPDAIQDKVFEPFFSTKEEGTGLGLAIVARIIDEHGGSLEVRSREGEGTTFLISLPCG